MINKLFFNKLCCIFVFIILNLTIMKKKLLSLITLIGAGVLASAQITINDTHIVGIGDVVEQAQDTLPTVGIGSAGANQTWNFSSIQQHTLDSLFFKNPSTLPGNGDFPTSNLGLKDSNEDSSWTFLTKNTAGLFVDGIHQIQSGQPTSIPITATIITFPSTMGTSFGDTWNGILFTFPLGQDPDGPGPHGTVDSLRVTREAVVNSNIDSWGNVTTPFGTFASLRQIVIEEDADTTWQLVSGVWEVMSTTTQTFLATFGVNQSKFAYDTIRTARWWTNDVSAKFPIIEMDYEANGSVNSVSWQKNSPFVGVEEMNAKPIFSLYPNPAKDIINISTDKIENSIISIFDITGKEVKSIDFNSPTISLNINDLDAGVYFYTVTNRTSGKTLQTNKFIVTK